MDVTTFAIWKFRYVEGFLEGMHPYDVTTTRYVEPVSGFESWIRYDYRTETAVIERVHRDDFIMSIEDNVVTAKAECRFSELTAKLKELGMYVERAPGNRHHLAGPQKEE